LAAFLIPVSRIAVMPAAVADIAPIHNIVERNVISTAEARNRLPATENYFATTSGIAAPSNASTPTLSALPAEEPGLLARAFTVFMVAYPLIFAIVLIYSLAGYALFIKRLRRGYMNPHSHELLTLSKLAKGRRTPRLIISSYAATPMLIGVFRPVIVLPNIEYTHAQLQSILLHELTHMRRFDIAVKWLSLLACAAHWFNPLIWAARREIDRICELSCDEAVIRNMNAHDMQNYGETLISVASTKKIPLPVLSTTMSAEMRAVKERLIAIMRKRKHTKLAFFTSALIILAAILVACTSGAATAGNNNETYGYSSNANDINEYPSYSNTNGTTSPLTIEDYAHAYIQSLLPYLNVFREDDGSITPATIIDTQINTLEKVAGFGHIFPQTIELWRLDFMIQTECIEDGNIRWGTFAPDAEGWLGSHMGWNDANILLAFIMHDSGPQFLWHIPWSFELHTNTQTIWGLETALRMVLEMRGYIPAMTFPGNHYIVYFASHEFEFGGYEYRRIFLSQPFGQGPDNIWVVERWQQLGSENNYIHHEFITHYALPHNLEFNQTFLEHAHDLQRLFDTDQAPWLASPYESAMEYMNRHSLGERIIGIYHVSTDISIPTSLAPHIFTADNQNESTAENATGESAFALTYALPDDIARYIEMAVSVLRPGTDRAYVERYLGTPHRVIAAYDGSYLYRHNILADPDYIATVTFTHDDIDIEAFQDGRVRLIAFARYTIPDILTSFTIIYSTQDGAIYEFRYLGDTFIQPGFDGNFFRHTRILD